MRRSLFQKYFATFFLAATVPLLANGISDAWFGYRDQRAMLNATLRVEASAAAGRIENFLNGIRDDLGWSVQRDWAEDRQDQHRLDALRVLRQATAVVSIALIDKAGVERLFVSRTELERKASGVDRSHDPAVAAAKLEGVWYGPITYYNGSEPFMLVSVAGNRAAAGVAVAEINLKLIWDVVSDIRVGGSGRAYVVDRLGQLVAHPDISKVPSGTNEEAARTLRRLQDAIEAGGTSVATTNTDGEPVIADMAAIKGTGWTVVVEQDTTEAFAPIYATLWRTSGLLLGATMLAAGLAFWLAKRMTGPVRLLEEGTRQIGAGQFEHRINISTGDELERLAARFNEMARELASSREREERIARLRRFLAPQVAEIVEKAGDDGVLLGHRAEVVVIFCDLRGFTAFSTEVEPEEIMQLLADYYQAVGSIVTTHEATVTNFSADGLMILVNAPISCAEPAMRAVEMAIAMQAEIQRLIRGWRERGHSIGFGLGIAMGWATVGRIGYEGRHDYTAIGNVVNLASRLCSSAKDHQILLDSTIAKAVATNVSVVEIGPRQLKGYGKELIVYEVAYPERANTDDRRNSNNNELAT
ncbi:adenylate/guanylate cyclase domain-containing protein [Mesorhizobium yinganensis]|uniref:adenylate/guanylate cyclase domain-containing protein n=1 Tax=Mesorhizobium yinganensis TaxID=3157707 RepID=UPI0032B7C822